MPRFDPKGFLRLISDHHVNYLATVPTIVCNGFCRSTAPRGSIRPLVATPHVAPGSTVPPNIQEAWIELVGAETVWELYGGTELKH